MKGHLDCQEEEEPASWDLEERKEESSIPADNDKEMEGNNIDEVK